MKISYFIKTFALLLAVIIVFGAGMYGLNIYTARISAGSVLRNIQHAATRLEQNKKLLTSALHSRINQHRAHLENLAAKIIAASPQNALDRGFALVSTPDGRLARDATALHSGDELRIRLARGETTAIVQK